MEINWTVLIITGLMLAVLLLFLVNRNRRDKKLLEKKLNEDFKKSKDEEGDIEIEDTKSVWLRIKSRKLLLLKSDNTGIW